MGFQTRATGEFHANGDPRHDWYVDISPDNDPATPVFGTVRLTASEDGVQIDVYPADISEEDGLVKCEGNEKEPIATWTVRAEELKEWAGYWNCGTIGLKTRYTNEAYK